MWTTTKQNHHEMARLRMALMSVLLLLLLRKDAAVSAAGRYYSKRACPSVATLYTDCSNGAKPRSCVAYPLDDNRTGLATTDAAASECYNVAVVDSSAIVGAGVEVVAGLSITTQSRMCVVCSNPHTPPGFVLALTRRMILLSFVCSKTSLPSSVLTNNSIQSLHIDDASAAGDSTLETL